MKYYIIAGSREQFEDYIRRDSTHRWNSGETSVSLSDYVYVYRSDQLRGLKDPKGAFIGTWKERKDIKEILLSLLKTMYKPNPSMIRIIGVLYDLGYAADGTPL